MPNIVTLKRDALDEGEHVLSTGVKVRIRPVSSVLIDKVTSRIEDPVPPKWYDPDREREVDNLTSPVYIAALERAARDRGIAALDVMMLMGVELVDGLPEGDGWIKKLKRLGAIDDTLDLSDEEEVRFAYLKYIAFGADDLGILTKSQVTEDDVKQAEGSFRGN